MTPRVVILGCGFGGLFAARALAKAPVEVTVGTTDMAQRGGGGAVEAEDGADVLGP